MRMPAAARGAGRMRHLIVAALLASLASAVAASGCDTPALGTVAGIEQSRWEELDTHGKSLVRERGTLKLAGLQGSGRCGAVEWTAQWARSQGGRSYDGLTTTQAPLQTHSHVRAQTLTLAAWLPVHNSWAVGAQFGHRQIQRDIASKGSVLGYPERFDYWQAALGMRYQTALAEGLRLTASGWFGAGPGGRVRVDLPRADPVTLPLGSSRLLALGLQLDGGETAQSGWSWQAGVAYRREEIGAGMPETISRNGVTVGAALQPRVVQQHFGATAILKYRF